MHLHHSHVDHPNPGQYKRPHRNVYDEDTLTHKKWTIIILLQALADGEFDWLWKQFITVMTKKDLNHTLDDIIKCLEAEVSKARVNEALGSQEAAMAAKLKKAPRDKPKAKCMNCTSKTHSFEACWEKGMVLRGRLLTGGRNLRQRRTVEGGKKKQEKVNAAIKKEDSSSSESCAAFIATVDTEPTPSSCIWTADT